MVTSTYERRYISIQQAAELAAVTPRTIRRHIANGKLPGYRFGSRVLRVELSEVDSLLRPIPTATAAGGHDANS